ncbi:AIPR family protein [Hymenobacter cellulosivorans]|uniref:AIPR family protein n=1 Tax=Hymenobacter cellulosivorans TaxID=2932249 RepID=A0ABY4FAL5_9BACT|nr:AIPR family protein [Hymenobacter cellulosivorans]UOQ53709.1 AIPR family protein [Hymenobacter cellulosivorans]
MTQKTNDQVILEQIVKEKCAESGNEISITEYFEIYTASEILKDFDLSYDDIKYGIVGDGGDGGIDSMFTFLNGELVKEDTEININQKKNDIELILIQAKTSFTFKEDAVVKFRETAEDLFNLSSNPDKFSKRYNHDLIDKVKIFRNVYSKLARNFPKLHIKYYYATQGDTVHHNVEGKVPKLREAIAEMFSGSQFSFEFIGAKKLLEMTRNVPSTSRMLEVSESPISTASGSYVCLVRLDKYYEFVSDAGALARSIFESNVRDYQGSITVNTGIRTTLQNQKSENFWYLNNGVTIITPKAVLAGKQLTIEDPQIVNGLQTSHEIYRHFSEQAITVLDERAILVRVICEADEEARDRIIRATNSQTAIPPASLRSSDEIHRNIEDFLKANGYYYDRKKNFYKNQGMPVAKTVSIPYLAQAMMAIILLKPDSARARPSTLINSDTEYKRIFSLDMPIDVYLKVIQIIKEVENFLKPSVCGIELERKIITNIKYYVAMVVGIEVAGSQDQIAAKISALPQIKIAEEILHKALDTVLVTFEELGNSDQVAKGPSLVSALIGRL